MRWELTVVLAVVSCEAQAQHELTRSQCTKLIQRIDKLESSDTSEHRAMQAAHRPSREGCLRSGTERAYRCVMQAKEKADLRHCDLLFK